MLHVLDCWTGISFSSENCILKRTLIDPLKIGKPNLIVCPQSKSHISFYQSKHLLFYFMIRKVCRVNLPFTISLVLQTCFKFLSIFHNFFNGNRRGDSYGIDYIHGRSEFTSSLKKWSFAVYWSFYKRRGRFLIIL